MKTSRRRSSTPACGRPAFLPERGFTLVELLVALTIVGTLAAAVVPSVRWVNLERQETERRLVAQVEANNALERVAVLPWERLRKEHVESWSLSPAARAVLPEGRLEIAIRDVPDSAPPTKEVRVAVTWKPLPHQTESPVRVTAWLNETPAR